MYLNVESAAVLAQSLLSCSCVTSIRFFLKDYLNRNEVTCSVNILSVINAL